MLHLCPPSCGLMPSCLQLPSHSRIALDTSLDGITPVITRNVRASEALTCLPFNRRLEELHRGGCTAVFPGVIVPVPSLLYISVYGSRYSVETLQGRPYGVATGIGALRLYAGGRGGEWSATEWCADWRDERVTLCVSMYQMQTVFIWIQTGRYIMVCRMATWLRALWCISSRSI